MTTKINVYKNGSEWCYAMWVGGEYDHSDTLDVLDSASEAEALAAAALLAPSCEVQRVSDLAAQ